MVYQDPMASLNPVMTVGRQLMEVPMLHEGLGDAAARDRALRMLGEVELPDPERVLARYTHQLSGCQQQRIVIAMALIAEPTLLIMVKKSKPDPAPPYRSLDIARSGDPADTRSRGGAMAIRTPALLIFAAVLAASGFAFRKPLIETWNIHRWTWQ